MGGFFGWFLAFAIVLAVFNAEKLPALKAMLEAKLKDSMEAAKKGTVAAQEKIKQVKTEIESKKNTPAPVAEPEENSPEEIDEALKFMDNIVKEKQNKKTKAPKKEVKDETIIVAPEKPTEDAPIDLEHRD